MSDARGHKHRPANGRKAGGVPHGEAKAWLVRQGRGGRKEANPRTTSVWNPLLLFDLASTTSSTLGKSGPSALSRLRQPCRRRAGAVPHGEAKAGLVRQG